jgi:hypothetical protein
MTERETTLEVAHEALFEQWPELQSWLSASRDDLRFQRRLDEAAEEWPSRGQEDDLLWRGGPLRAARGVPRPRETHGSAEGVLRRLPRLEAPGRGQARGAAAARKGAQRPGLQNPISVPCPPSEQETAGGNATNGILLALEALPKDMHRPERPRVVEAEASLYRGILEHRERWIASHQGRVLSAAFSPDGAKVVTASEDRSARLWEAASGKELAVLQGHEGMSCRRCSARTGPRW